MHIDTNNAGVGAAESLHDVEGNLDGVAHNGTSNYVFNCDTISNSTYERIVELLSLFTPSQQVIDQLNALCPHLVTGSTVPYNYTTTEEPVEHSGMSDEEGLGILIGVACVVGIILVVVGVILWKKRIIGRKDVDVEKGQSDSSSSGDVRSTADLNKTKHDISNPDKAKHDRDVMILRSAHKDGTAPRANGLPTIRMYIMNNRPLMLEALWEVEDELTNDGYTSDSSSSHSYDNLASSSQ